MVTKKQIIDSLRIQLDKDPHVHAFWLEGGDAQGSSDEYSDLDIWIDVDDEKVDQAFSHIRSALESLSPILSEGEFDHSHPKIRQKYYCLKDASPYLIVDACVQKHSREFWYRTGFQDEVVSIIFDKSNVIQFKDPQQSDLESVIKTKADIIEGYLSQFSRVEKYIHRKQFLTGLVYYHNWILEPLVKLLRIMHTPTKIDHYLKNIEKDLPERDVKKLTNLFQVQSLEGIKNGMATAQEWFRELQKETE